MSYGDLKITFESVAADPLPLVVTVNRWQGMPRLSQQELQGSNRYATSGNLVIGGTTFEMRPLFRIETWLPQADADKIQAMWEIREKRRRAVGYWQFVVDDETELFYEEATAATKTRSHVAGTAVTERNKGCYYFPRWQCDMPLAPEFGVPTGSGNRQTVFTLQETGVKI